jgi:hypothetical protein
MADEENCKYARLTSIGPELIGVYRRTTAAADSRHVPYFEIALPNDFLHKSRPLTAVTRNVNRSGHKNAGRLFI